MDTITPHEDEIARLNRIEGQIRGIQKMIKQKRDCVDVLTQLASASAALKRVEENILSRHLKSCVISSFTVAAPEDRARKIEEIVDILRTFRK